MTWVMRRAPVLRQTCRHARETVSPNPSIAHTKDGRWVMASLGNREGDAAAARRAARALRHGGRLRSRSRPRCPKADGSFPAPDPITQKRDRRHGGRSALRARVHLREHAVARSAGGGAAVGAAAQAARERDRSALARARKRSPTSSIPSWAAPSAMPRASGSAPRHRGRSAAARRCSNEDAETVMTPVKRTHPVISPSARVDAERKAVAPRQAVSTAWHPHPRLHVVPGLGRRHAVHERVRRREHQGRIEEPSGHAARRDGAGRRARSARQGHGARCPA